MARSLTSNDGVYFVPAPLGGGMIAMRGFRAPETCIKAVEAAVSLPFDQGLKRERELFVELLNSPESKAQRYFFFAEREAAKIPDVPADTPTLPIRKAAVLGAGTMGGGIAMNFANVGIPVTVVEVSREALERGLGVEHGGQRLPLDFQQRERVFGDGARLGDDGDHRLTDVKHFALGKRRARRRGRTQIVRSRPIRRRQPAAIDLALRGERQPLEHHEGGRQHVVGQAGGQAGAQLGGAKRDARRRHHIGHQPPIAVAGGLQDDVPTIG